MESRKEVLSQLGISFTSFRGQTRAVESVCKTVVGQRLKLAGMRWGEDGAHAVCHLRALYRSEKGRWKAFWNRDFSYN